jgi:hypothetical protein
MQWMIY